MSEVHTTARGVDPYDKTTVSDIRLATRTGPRIPVSTI